jgi:outer membrane receptor protein involved in Fe transport
MRRASFALQSFLTATLLFLVAPVLQAQQTTGRVVGRVIDAASGAGLADAGVQVVGTTLGAMSGIDGRFVIPNVPAGTVTLQVRRIGYAPKTVTGLVLEAGKALEQDITLAQASVQLTAQVVTAEAERGTVNAALDAQRTSVNVVSSITSEQIAKSPDGDAAQAVGRVSGVNVQDGKYVYVRGLGDRYTQASLNGARIPSPEPERKVVPLDLFPTGLLQSITTVKTFTPDQPGDFSGATVNIETKEFPARRTWAMSTSVGASDNVLGSKVPMPGRVGGDLFALGAANRALPGFIQQFGNFATSLPGQGDYNRMVSEFRNAWTPRAQEGGLNGSTSLSVGGNDPLFGQRIGYLVSGTYSYSQEARLDQVRALALAQAGSTPSEIDRYEGNSGKSSVLWGGVANLSTLLGSRTRLALNNTYNRTMDSEARVERGFSENLGIPFDIARQKYVERSVYSSQLMLQRDLTDRQKLEVAVGISGVSREEPDRSEFVRATFTDPETGAPMAPQWFSSSNEGAVRSFAKLTEDAIEARGHWRIQFGEAGRTLALKLGGLGRHGARDATSTAYSINASGITQAERELPAEQIFNGRYTATGDAVWRVTPIGVGGTYTASDYQFAGFAMVEKELGSRWQLITGARAEYSDVLVEAEPTVGALSRTNPTFLDVLPAVALTYRPSEAVNIRLSASQTVSRPEYRELAPIQYREVIGFDNVSGNPDLKRALIQNLDLRWEWYLGVGEVVSVGAFAKRFTDPIERVYRGSSGTRMITFVNAEGADNYGVELEARKNLDFLHERLANLSLSTNVTLMESRIRLGGGSAVTSQDRAMVGQAPYMLNTGLTWTSNTGATSATLLYNVVGARITDAGELPLPDVRERERHVLDFSLRLPLHDRLSARLDARNLLDAPYETVQGPVTRERYRVGRGYSLGFSWRP